MEKIVKITQEKPPMYRIWLESGEQLLVSEDMIVKKRLLKDLLLTTEEVEDIRQESQIDYGYQRALHYLSYQLRTEQEIGNYLKKQEIASRERQLIIERLKRLGLVDDRVFGESYVRTMVNTGEKGPRVLAQQLKQKGLNEALITEVLELYTEEMEQQICSRVAKKAFKKYAKHSHQAQSQKTQQFLYTKGFTASVIHTTLADLLLEKDERHEQSLLAKEATKLWQKHQRLSVEKRRQKVLQSLYQKGFSFDESQAIIREKEMEDEE